MSYDKESQLARARVLCKAHKRGWWYQQAAVAVGTRPSAMQRHQNYNQLEEVQICRSWHAPECYPKINKQQKIHMEKSRSWHAPECYAK